MGSLHTLKIPPHAGFIAIAKPTARLSRYECYQAEFSRMLRQTEPLELPCSSRRIRTRWTTDSIHASCLPKSQPNKGNAKWRHHAVSQSPLADSSDTGQVRDFRWWPAYTSKEVADVLRYLDEGWGEGGEGYDSLVLNIGEALEGSDRRVPLALARKNVTINFSRSEALPRILADMLRVQGVRITREVLGRKQERVANAWQFADTELQNKVWFLAHCQAVRDGSRSDQLFMIDGVLEKYSGLTVLGSDYPDEAQAFRPAETPLWGSAAWLPSWLRGGADHAPAITYELCYWALSLSSGDGDRVAPLHVWPSVTFAGETMRFEWAAFHSLTPQRSILIANSEVEVRRKGQGRGCSLKKIRDRTSVFSKVLFEV